LNPRPPALEASTVPLGYRGGGLVVIETFAESILLDR